MPQWDIAGKIKHYHRKAISTIPQTKEQKKKKKKKKTTTKTTKKKQNGEARSP